MHHQVQELGDIRLERPAFGFPFDFGVFRNGHDGIPG